MPPMTPPPKSAPAIARSWDSYTVVSVSHSCARVARVSCAFAHGARLSLQHPGHIDMGFADLATVEGLVPIV